MNDAITLHDDNSEIFVRNYKTKRFIERKLILINSINKRLKKKSRILDVGCGPGIISIEIAKLGYDVVGFDGSKKMIEYAKKLKHKNKIQNIEFYKANIHDELKSISSNFDGVIFSSVLEYLENYEEIIQLTHKLLKTNGFLFASMPNSRSIYRFYERLAYKIIKKPAYYKYVVNYLTASRFSETVTELGFITDQIEYFSKKNNIFNLLAKILPPHIPNNMYLGIYKKHYDNYQ